LLSWDLSGTTYSVLANNCPQASVSDDGKWAAFARRDTLLPKMQVWLRDVANNTEVMISSNVVTHGMGNRDSINPKITSDGRFIVFQSRATNLVENDSNGTADIFLYDREKQRLDLVSVGRSGGTANGASLRPVVSPDDTYVAFVSFASDLVSHDYNEGSDIFAAYLPAPDTDADGIDDRWEIAQFGDLNHDLTGDSDGDGMSDSSEFAAGTNPAQATSAVRVMDASVDGDGKVNLQWSSVPGRVYRVQARLRFDSSNPWLDASDAIVASGATSSFNLQVPSASELYFRIVTAD
jgi:Tol biopolymer transport system component